MRPSRFSSIALASVVFSTFAAAALATPQGYWHSLPSCPVPHAEHSAIYDPIGDRMIVFGGWTGVSYIGETNETWELTLSGSPAWSLLASQGTRPSARHGHAAIYDPPRQRMLVYGGVFGSTELWELTLSGTPTWQRLFPAGGEPHVYPPSAVYDSRRDRMIVVGDEVWALTLSGTSTWSQLMAPGTPVSGPAVYDPMEDRVIAENKELRLSGPLTWQPLNPTGTPHPTSIYGRWSIIFDWSRDRLVQYGGFNFYCPDMPPCYGVQFTNVTAMMLPGAPAWQALTSGPGKCDHSAIYDGTHDRMVIMGGSHRTGLNQFPEADTWALEWESPLGLPVEAPPHQFALRLSGSNPAAAGARFELQTSERAEVSVCVFDARGARIAELVHAELPPGRHPLEWPGTDAAGRAAPAGIYFVTAVTGSTSSTVSIVVVQ